jgi:transcriptional regulator of acetoin/glycerol metabolism
MTIGIESDNIGGGMFSHWLYFTRSSCNKDKLQYYTVRKEILDSWVRCREAKVEPNVARLHRRLADAELQTMLERNRKLISIAEPFMKNLYRIVAGSGFVVALTDGRGYIMEILGDQDMLVNPMTESFYQGAGWSEEEAGTNAIGTVLVIKEPIQVTGSEHYCRMHHGITCSAAPIFDPQGNLLGTLDISGASTAAHLHTLGMVVAGVEAIMAQLVLQEKNNELNVINKRLTNIFNTMSDGVIMIDQNGMITDLNPVVAKIIDAVPGNMEVRSRVSVECLLGDKQAVIRKMLKDKKGFVDIEIMIDTSNGLNHCLASGTPVTDEQGHVLGAVIVLQPMQQVQSLVNRFSGHYGTLHFSDIIGESKAILEAVRVASLAAASTTNVLLQGESGTGKEIFAQAIHNRSKRCAGPFIAVNCGALPRELIGSELFGYADGAFTGAKRGGKPGKFELASGGTIFLDEIGDMPLEQQVVLLRVLQERKVTRIGCEQEIPVDVRVICATNKKLMEEIDKGTFRRDLYYRLNVISITVPPLRQRVEDIIRLFNYFLEKLDKHGRRFEVDKDVVEQIICYDWPGNVRELQNVVERIVSLTEGNKIKLENLPQEIRGWQTSSPKEETESPVSDIEVATLKAAWRQRLWESDERNEIMAMLSRYKGNVSLTARTMGISRNTLYRKIKYYSIYS